MPNLTERQAGKNAGSQPSLAAPRSALEFCVVDQRIVDPVPPKWQSRGVDTVLER